MRMFHSGADRDAAIDCSSAHAMRNRGFAADLSARSSHVPAIFLLHPYSFPAITRMRRVQEGRDRLRKALALDVLVFRATTQSENEIEGMNSSCRDAPDRCAAAARGILGASRTPSRGKASRAVS